MFCYIHVAWIPAPVRARSESPLEWRIYLQPDLYITGMALFWSQYRFSSGNGWLLLTLWKLSSGLIRWEQKTA